jgi:MFS family permease
MTCPRRLLTALAQLSMSEATDYRLLTKLPYRTVAMDATTSLHGRAAAAAPALTAISLVTHDSGGRDWQPRLIFFVAWLALIAWFCSTHVFWRDEVRALTLALSGSNVVEMLRNVHGEGHPALWYLILRAAHELFPYREVLPAAGALFGIAAMAVLTFFSPIRLAIVALVLFSGYGAFEYVVIARNYGIAALVMLTLAALYGRVRDTLWLGVILAILCNTNVPSCILAAAFLLFRFVEMLADGSRPGRREWLMFAGNVLLASFGAYLCFITVYPTFNDAAVSSNFSNFGVGQIGAAVLDTRKGFSHLIVWPAVLAISCLAFVRRPAALCAAVAAFLILKFFFYFVYQSYYRHEVLYIFFLLSLFWMTANGAGGTWPQKRWMHIDVLGGLAFLSLLAVHSIVLAAPVTEQLAGKPYSHSADVAKLLQRPELSGAIVMADPDTMLEALPYYVDNPLWLLRQQRFGKVTRLSENARRNLTLDDVLADADRLHRATGRPIVFLSHLQVQAAKPKRIVVMFDDATILTPESVDRFRASTRQIASLGGLGLNDENYEVYVYPR